MPTIILRTDSSGADDNAPAHSSGVDYSDHSNFWGFGYQAVIVTDAAKHRNLNYYIYKDWADDLDHQAVKVLLHYMGRR